VKVAEILLCKNIIVCNTIQANRGLPSDLLKDAKCYRKVSARFEGRLTDHLQIWKINRSEAVPVFKMQKPFVLTKRAEEGETISRSFIALFNTSM
jgi:hypothetical protein